VMFFRCQVRSGWDDDDSLTTSLVSSGEREQRCSADEDEAAHGVDVWLWGIDEWWWIDNKVIGMDGLSRC
jgi:hypothetical protein